MSAAYLRGTGCGDCLELSDGRGPICTMNCSSAVLVWPVKSADLIKLLDDPHIAAAVNEKGGGRWS